ncbi:hypothetical protein [Bacillus sp. B1-b2]|uniref:hypothetical protein n=1 Tax=Bacillus sp. B1-b2 TaxID=2653201 RepID=UPI001869E1A2|nr:hypothetical protein [Bacillus sp. B1-b2]
MKDNTIDYSKILDALNNSLNLVNADIHANDNVREQLFSAQQNVQQAMTYSLSKKIY